MENIESVTFLYDGTIYREISNLSRLTTRVARPSHHSYRL